MTVCDRVRADAPGLASLPPDDPGRVAAWAHAQGCAGCARALREAERLQRLVGAATLEPLPAGALERASAIAVELRREARRRSLGAVAGGCAAFALVLALARQRSGSVADWGLAAGLAVVALGLAAAASRRPVLVAAGAVGVALVAAVASGHAGPVAADEGVRCLAAELTSAAIVVGAGWLAIPRGSTSSPPRLAWGAAAAAGALAGYAALEVTCAAHDAMPHLLAFHLAGVLVAAVAATLVRWPVPRAAL